MPNSKERELLIQLMILRNALATSMDNSKERIRRLKYGWRDARLLLTLTDKLQAGLLDTVPDKYYRQYVETAKHAKLRVELPGPIRRASYTLIDNGELGTLAEYALKGD